MARGTCTRTQLAQQLAELQVERPAQADDQQRAVLEQAPQRGGQNRRLHERAHAEREGHPRPCLLLREHSQNRHLIVSRWQV